MTIESVCYMQEGNAVARKLYDVVAELSGFIVYHKQL